MCSAFICDSKVLKWNWNCDDYTLSYPVRAMEIYFLFNFFIIVSEMYVILKVYRLSLLSQNVYKIYKLEFFRLYLAVLVSIHPTISLREKLYIHNLHLYIFEVLVLKSVISIAVEGIWGHWPQVAVGERAQASTIQNEDLFPGPHRCQIPFLVLLASVEEVQEDHWWNCVYQGK